MPKKVRKVFGEIPADVVVLSTMVSFDGNGDAEVEDDIAEILEQIPGYEVAGEMEDHDPEDTQGTDEEPSDDEEAEEPSEEDAEEVAEEAPKKPARPARKSPSRK